MADNEKRFNLEIHPTVFWVSAGLMVFFVLATLTNLERASETFNAVQSAISTSAGWFYVLSVNIYLGIVVYLLLSRYGHIRLGGTEAQPDFSYWGWFSMLFSAGMGIGLLFFSVAEPIYHYGAPPWGEGNTVASAELAMSVTFFHWGIHAWGLYGLMALGLAYFAYNKGLPLTIRSVFYPLIGERIHGGWGNAIDILAAVSTLFGLATSLGLGAQQVNAGLAYLFDVSQTTGTQVILIAAFTGMATLSLVLGLDKGIRRLSQFNMIAAVALLLFVLFLGPTFRLLDAFVQNIGQYIVQLPRMSLWTEAYRQTEWQHSWSIFYWAWWIAWAPFVGVFVARISRGRTIREFLLGVLLVPTLMTFAWLTVFGNTALFEEMSAGGLVQAVNDNVSTALFVLLDRFPLASLTSGLGIVVVTVFFVTSSDSASFVVDIITSGGHPNPPVSQRIFWAILEGVIAAVLLLGGGLKALQTAVIVTGLPFAVILLLLGVSLLRGLRQAEGSKIGGDAPAKGQ